MLDVYVVTLAVCSVGTWAFYLWIDLRFAGDFLMTALPALWQGDGGWPLSFAPVATGANALSPWIDGSAWALIAAYAFGLIAASGICLPTL